MGAAGQQRRAAVLAGRVSIDLDATDVEVYGASKHGMAYNYRGQRCGRPHLATWAEAGLTLAADLLTGVQDVRAHSSALLGRAVAALPTDVREGGGDTHRPVVRADAGYFAAEAISTDPRSRRRRTIDRDQLALVLDGIAEHGWATSFIVTNLPTGGAGFDSPRRWWRVFGCAPTSRTASAKPSSGPG